MVVLPDQKQVEISELTWEVEAIAVTDEPSVRVAQELRNRANKQIKWIESFCSESVKKAHEAHKAAKAQEKALKGPIEKIKDILSLKLKLYANEVLKKEQEAQRKLDELRAKSVQDEAEDPSNESLPIIPVQVQSSLTEGWRDSWEWEVEDESLVPSEYWILDEQMIGMEVRAKKEKTNIPGIKIVKKKIPVSSR